MAISDDKSVIIGINPNLRQQTSISRLSCCHFSCWCCRVLDSLYGVTKIIIKQMLIIKFSKILKQQNVFMIEILLFIGEAKLN